MSDRIQNIQKATEAVLTKPTSRRGLLLLGAALAGSQILKSRPVAALGGCEPLPTDGRPPLCVNTDNDVFGQSYFGGFYFEDRNGDKQFTPGIDEQEQGVKDRQLLIEEIRFKGSGDYVQLNPESRKVNGSEVSYMDVKAGNNSGERFVDRWTVFQLPPDGGDGLGIDLGSKERSKRLLIAVGEGSLVDKVWASVDDGKRAGRHECSGECQWNCVRFIQISRLKSGFKVDLNQVIPNDAIHRDRNTNALSSYTDYAWLWDTMAQSNAHVDYSAITTPLTDELRANEKVVKSHVSIPGRLSPYTNFSR